jgi:hypothetical protein
MSTKTEIQTHTLRNNNTCTIQMNAGLICNHYELSNCRNLPDILPGKISGVDIN